MVSFLYAAVCVAGFSEERVNEIIQLALPEKLLPPEHQVVTIIDPSLPSLLPSVGEPRERVAS